MKDLDKYRAQIETELTKFGKSIEELERENERQKDKFQVQRRDQLENIKEKKSQAEDRLKEIDRSKEENKHQLLEELRGFVKDIDDNLRRAFSYVAY